MDAVIVGAHGQDGRLLGDRLERAGRSIIRLGRGDIDLLNPAAGVALVQRHHPRTVYYLAAHHHSSEDPLGDADAELLRKSFDVHVTGLVNILEAMRRCSPSTRLFYAASSHVFGQSDQPLQNELTPLNPTCAYGITKTAGVHCCRYYRNTRGLFASVGILYNHESPYRSPKFVSQKIIRGARAIASGRQDQLILGDLSARVDWGYAPDYVEAMRGILELPKADEFVIATGESHSVQEFVEIVFAALGLDWRRHVRENAAQITKQRRNLSGDASKLKRATGWQPTVSFRQMVEHLLTGRGHGL
jgi:GDPmannose 4,6-dehydratase